MYIDLNKIDEINSDVKTFKKELKNQLLRKYGTLTNASIDLKMCQSGLSRMLNSSSMFHYSTLNMLANKLNSSNEKQLNNALIRLRELQFEIVKVNKEISELSKSEVS